MLFQKKIRNLRRLAREHPADLKYWASLTNIKLEKRGYLNGLTETMRELHKRLVGRLAIELGLENGGDVLNERYCFVVEGSATQDGSSIVEKRHLKTEIACLPACKSSSTISLGWVPRQKKVLYIKARAMCWF